MFEEYKAFNILNINDNNSLNEYMELSKDLLKTGFTCNFISDNNNYLVLKIRKNVVDNV